jgi:hypothetical protein
MQTMEVILQPEHFTEDTTINMDFSVIVHAVSSYTWVHLVKCPQILFFFTFDPEIITTRLD